MSLPLLPSLRCIVLLSKGMTLPCYGPALRNEPLTCLLSRPMPRLVTAYDCHLLVKQPLIASRYKSLHHRSSSVSGSFLYLAAQTSHDDCRQSTVVPTPRRIHSCAPWTGGLPCYAQRGPSVGVTSVRRREPRVFRLLPGVCPCYSQNCSRTSSRQSRCRE